MGLSAFVVFQMLAQLCNILQLFTTFCSTTRHVAIFCNSLHHSMLQHVAKCFKMLQRAYRCNPAGRLDAKCRIYPLTPPPLLKLGVLFLLFLEGSQDASKTTFGAPGRLKGSKKISQIQPLGLSFSTRPTRAFWQPLSGENHFFAFPRVPGRHNFSTFFQNLRREGFWRANFAILDRFWSFFSRNIAVFAEF